MESGKYELQSPFAKKYIALGKAEGEAKGKAECKAEAVLLVLTTRGLPISENVRQRVLSCENAATLERWLERSVTVETAAGLFD